jgi:hypothetical protein
MTYQEVNSFSGSHSTSGLEAERSQDLQMYVGLESGDLTPCGLEFEESMQSFAGDFF